MPTRVVFLIVDGLPHRHVQPHTMPTLWKLATATGHSVGYGRAMMTSSTQPNHATFTTGVAPAEHGVIANTVFTPDGPATATPAVATLFDAATAAGLHSEAIIGDPEAVASSGAMRATRHWPVGPVPPGTVTDHFGHADDDLGTAKILEALSREPALLMARINQVDTACHVHGPDSEAAVEAFRRADQHIATIVEHLRPAWEDTLLCIVSDHDQETATDPEPIDLILHAQAHGHQLQVLSEGAAALVRGPAHLLHSTWLRDTPGVGGVIPVNTAPNTAPGIATSAADPAGEATALVWAAPGRWFGREGDPHLKGMHGSPRTTTQVAVITGGHPAAARLAREVTQRPPAATFWAPMIASVLEMPDPRSMPKRTQPEHLLTSGGTSHEC